MSLGIALATGLVAVVFVVLASAARGRLRHPAGKDGAFLPSGGSTDSSGSGFDAGGCDGGGGAGDG